MDRKSKGVIFNFMTEVANESYFDPRILIDLPKGILNPLDYICRRDHFAVRMDWELEKNSFDSEIDGE